MAWRRFRFDNIWWSENTLKNYPTLCIVIFSNDVTITLLPSPLEDGIVALRETSPRASHMKVGSQLRILSKRICVFSFFISLYIHVEVFHQGYTHQQLFIMQHEPHHCLCSVVLHIILSKSLWLVSSMSRMLLVRGFPLWTMSRHLLVSVDHICNWAINNLRLLTPQRELGGE